MTLNINLPKSINSSSLQNIKKIYFIDIKIENCDLFREIIYILDWKNMWAAN